MAWTDFKGKQVFIVIETSKGDRRYSGVVNEVTYIGKNINGIETYFIEIIDKFNFKVGFNSTQIKVMEEEI